MSPLSGSFYFSFVLILLSFWTKLSLCHLEEMGGGQRVPSLQDRLIRAFELRRQLLYQRGEINNKSAASIEDAKDVIPSNTNTDDEMENHKLDKRPTSNKNNNKNNSSKIGDELRSAESTPKDLQSSSSEEQARKIMLSSEEDGDGDLDESGMLNRDAGSLHLPQPALPAETTPSDEYLDDRSAEESQEKQEATTTVPDISTSTGSDDVVDLKANEVKIGFSDEDDLDKKVSLLREFWKEVSGSGVRVVENDVMGNECKRRSDLFYKMLFRTEGVSLENDEAQRLDGVDLGHFGGSTEVGGQSGMKSVLFDKDEVSLLLVGGGKAGSSLDPSQPASCHDAYEMCGHDISGMKDLLMESPQKCQLSCVEEPKCRFWTFDSARSACSLKGPLAPCEIFPSIDSSIISGPRVCQSGGIEFDFSACPVVVADIESSVPKPPPPPPLPMKNRLLKSRVAKKKWKKHRSPTERPKRSTTSTTKMPTILVLDNRIGKNLSVGHDLKVPKSYKSVENCFDQDHTLCGSNLRILRSVDTLEECQKRCQSHKGCQLWTWSGENKVCYLKTNGAICRRRVSRMHVVSGPKYCDGRGPMVDLKSCQSDFNLTTENDTECRPDIKHQLKSRISNGDNDNACFMPGHNLKGGSQVSSAFAIDSPIQCQLLCSRQAECSHFVWDLTEDKCTLLSGAVCAQKHHPKLVSGKKDCNMREKLVGCLEQSPTTATIKTTFKVDIPTVVVVKSKQCWRNGMDITGDDMKTVLDVSSPESCQRSCQSSVSRCAFWVWVKSAPNRTHDACYLKQEGVKGCARLYNSNMGIVAGPRVCNNGGLERIPSCESLILKNGRSDPTLTETRHLHLNLTKTGHNRLGRRKGAVDSNKRGNFKKRQFDSKEGKVEVKGVDNAFDKKHFEAKKNEVESSRVERRKKKKTVIKDKNSGDLAEDVVMDRKLRMVNREGNMDEGKSKKKNESFGVGVWFTRGWVNDESKKPHEGNEEDVKRHIVIRTKTEGRTTSTTHKAWSTDSTRVKYKKKGNDLVNKVFNWVEKEKKKEDNNKKKSLKGDADAKYDEAVMFWIKQRSN